MDDLHLARVSVGVAQPDDEFGEIGRGRLQYAAFSLIEETVIPQQAGTIRFKGGRRSPRCGLPVQKLLDLGDEVEVGVDQVEQTPEVRNFCSYHSG